MSDGTLNVVVNIGGSELAKEITKTADHPNPYAGIVLAGGKAASSWVKTDADTAACNLAGGHGYSTGKMDVYWTSGTTGLEHRHDVDVTVTGDALALDGGSGDDFPATDDTTVVVCTHQQINTAIDGDAVEQAPPMGAALDTAFILGIAKVNGVKILLDIDKVLSAAELSSVHATAQAEHQEEEAAATA